MHDRARLNLCTWRRCYQTPSCRKRERRRDMNGSVAALSTSERLRANLDNGTEDPETFSPSMH